MKNTISEYWPKLYGQTSYHKLLMGMLCAIFCSPLLASEPLVVPLTRTSPSLRVESWSARSDEVTPTSPHSWRIQKEVLKGGRQEGVDLITLDNGSLRLRILPTRGMGIWDVVSGDLRLGWDSPVKEAVHPQFINLSSRGGMGWLEGFNEWFVRCGLESAGFPGADVTTNASGAETTTELTLHGKIANIPASEVEVVMERKPPFTLRIRGRVEERMFYGPKLVLQTELSIVPGEKSFHVTDKITNEGDYEQEFQMIYHINFGTPLLEKGSRYVAPIKSIFPFNEHTATGLNTLSEYQGPAPGFVEHIYCTENHAAPDGTTSVMLKNQKGDKAASLTYSVAELPYFTLWKNTAPLKEGYVTGFEPATGFPYNRMIEREQGRVPKLKPGESRKFTLEFRLHTTVPEVRRMEEEIQSTQKSPAKISPQPPTYQ